MKLKIEYKPIDELKPYKNNPRKNDSAVEVVKKSIQEFGFKVPIIIDENNEIIAGHTRFKAAKELNMTEVPTIKASDLTPEQVKAFRIMDNKSQEFSFWDEDLLKQELSELKLKNVDLGITGFEENEVLLREVDDLNLDDEKEIITVNPPEAPRLKERFGFYFKKKEDYDKVKSYFLEDGFFNEKKLLDLIK
ncbi:MAG: hypothetical protein PWQ59_435 [Thermoanaerobacterium sp.]|nr:hypothetical protein [Thermoanaerobacterium sp.]